MFTYRLHGGDNDSELRTIVIELIGLSLPDIPGTPGC